jgi:hypothetical protein
MGEMGEMGEMATRSAAGVEDAPRLAPTASPACRNRSAILTGMKLK